MFITSRSSETPIISTDYEILKKLTFFYSGITSVTLSCLIFALFQSETHLLLGNRRMFPLYLFLFAFEIFKWCFNVIIYKQDSVIQRVQNFRGLVNLKHFREFINCKDVIRSAVIIFICCVVYYVIAVLFGAQVFSKQEETLMFSILITLLTILPLCIQFDSFSVEDFFQLLPPTNMFNSLLYSNSECTLTGAWFGAFVIPLDWDRPWQMWPIPCSLGALIGCTISNYIYLIQISIMYCSKPNKKFI